MHCYLIISAGHRALNNSEYKKGLNFNVLRKKNILLRTIQFLPCIHFLLIQWDLLNALCQNLFKLISRSIFGAWYLLIYCPCDQIFKEFLKSSAMNRLLFNDCLKIACFYLSLSLQGYFVFSNQYKILTYLSLIQFNLFSKRNLITISFDIQCFPEVIKILHRCGRMIYFILSSIICGLTFYEN